MLHHNKHMCILQSEWGYVLIQHAFVKKVDKNQDVHNRIWNLEWQPVAGVGMKSCKEWVPPKCHAKLSHESTSLTTWKTSNLAPSFSCPDTALQPTVEKIQQYPQVTGKIAVFHIYFSYAYSPLGCSLSSHTHDHVEPNLFIWKMSIWRGQRRACRVSGESSIPYPIAVWTTRSRPRSKLFYYLQSEYDDTKCCRQGHIYLYTYGWFHAWITRLVFIHFVHADAFP